LFAEPAATAGRAGGRTRRAWGQVLLNLGYNAVKFTERGRRGVGSSASRVVRAFRPRPSTLRFEGARQRGIGHDGPEQQGSPVPSPFLAGRRVPPARPLRRHRALGPGDQGRPPGAAGWGGEIEVDKAPTGVGQPLPFSACASSSRARAGPSRPEDPRWPEHPELQGKPRAHRPTTNARPAPARSLFRDEAVRLGLANPTPPPKARRPFAPRWAIADGGRTKPYRVDPARLEDARPGRAFECAWAAWAPARRRAAHPAPRRA